MANDQEDGNESNFWSLFRKFLGDLRWLSGRGLAIGLSLLLIFRVLGFTFSSTVSNPPPPPECSPAFRAVLILFLVLAALSYGCLYDALQRPRLPWQIGRVRKLGGGFSYPNPNPLFYLFAGVAFSIVLLALLYMGLIGKKDESKFNDQTSSESMKYEVVKSTQASGGR